MYIFRIVELRNDFIRSIIISMLLFGISFILHSYNLTIFYINTDFVIIGILTLMTIVSVFALVIHILPENNKIRFMKRHPLYTYVGYAFIQTMILLMVTLILQYMAYTLDIRSYFYLFILTFFLIWSIISTLRCLWLLDRMVNLAKS